MADQPGIQTAIYMVKWMQRYGTQQQQIDARTRLQHLLGSAAG